MKYIRDEINRMCCDTFSMSLSQCEEAETREQERQKLIQSKWESILLIEDQFFTEHQHGNFKFISKYDGREFHFIVNRNGRGWLSYEEHPGYRIKAPV